VSFYNIEGHRFSTPRRARMPDGGKAVLHAQMEAELRPVLWNRSELRLLKVTDKATRKWEFLSSL
jgi:hypothetical protein